MFYDVGTRQAIECIAPVLDSIDVGNPRFCEDRHELGIRLEVLDGRKECVDGPRSSSEGEGFEIG